MNELNYQTTQNECNENIDQHGHVSMDVYGKSNKNVVIRSRNLLDRTILCKVRAKMLAEREYCSESPENFLSFGKKPLYLTLSSSSLYFVCHSQTNPMLVLISPDGLWPRQAQLQLICLTKPG